MCSNRIMPIVDRNRCLGCGVCYAVCKMRVFTLRRGKAWVLNPDRCNSCGLCEKLCPTHAITLVKSRRIMPEKPPESIIVSRGRGLTLF